MIEEVLVMIYSILEEKDYCNMDMVWGTWKNENNWKIVVNVLLNT